MANGHGGARIGAGQKKKALSDKLAEGNPGKRKLTVVEFTDTADLRGEQMPPPRAYLAARQKSGRFPPLSAKTPRPSATSGAGPLRLERLRRGKS